VRFEGNEVVLLDAWTRVMAYAVGRSTPPQLVLHSTVAGRSARIISKQLLIGREGVVNVISSEWELLKIELDDGVLLGLYRFRAHAADQWRRPLAHCDSRRAERPRLGAYNRRKVRALVWNGDGQGKCSVHLVGSSLAPLGVRPKRLLALGWECRVAVRNGSAVNAFWP